MNAEEKLIESKIAAEDIARDIDHIIDRIRRVLICDTRPEQIHALSPELFEVQFAIARTHTAVAQAKTRLMTSIGMHPRTRLVPLSQKC